MRYVKAGGDFYNPPQNDWTPLLLEIDLSKDLR